MQLRKYIKIIFSYIAIIFHWNAEAVTTCSLVNISSFDFGDMNILDATEETTTGSFQVECNNDTGASVTISYDVSFGPGQNYSVDTRALEDVTEGNQEHDIPYNLYLEPSHSTILGDGTTGAKITGSFTIPANSTETDDIKYFYAKIPIFVDPIYPVGSYSDNVELTLNYEEEI